MNHLIRLFFFVSVCFVVVVVVYFFCTLLFHFFFFFFHDCCVKKKLDWSLKLDNRDLWRVCVQHPTEYSAVNFKKSQPISIVYESRRCVFDPRYDSEADFVACSASNELSKVTEITIITYMFISKIPFFSCDCRLSLVPCPFSKVVSRYREGLEASLVLKSISGKVPQLKKIYIYFTFTFN